MKTSVNSESGHLQRYLREVNQYELLSKEEETKLAVQVREHGNQEAVHRLITSNLRLVVKIAIEFRRAWMQSLLDLIQEGNIGLMQAAQKFDPYKGAKFSYYASFWIKAYILKFIMDNWRLVKIGTTQAQRKLFFRLGKEKRKLTSEGFDPEPGLIAGRLGVSEKEVTNMDQRLNEHEAELGVLDRENWALHSDTSLQPVEAQIAKKEMEAIIRKKLSLFEKRLNKKEVYILRNRVCSDTPMTLREIGERYSITRERVRQIEDNMIKRMRKRFRVGRTD